jgi:hypothetical protein
MQDYFFVAILCSILCTIFNRADAEEPQAETFYKEAVKQNSISRPDLALPLAEKAYHLETDNNEYRKFYCRLFNASEKHNGDIEKIQV